MPGVLFNFALLGFVLFAIVLSAVNSEFIIVICLLPFLGLTYTSVQKKSIVSVFDETAK